MPAFDPQPHILARCHHDHVRGKGRRNATHQADDARDRVPHLASTDRSLRGNPVAASQIRLDDDVEMLAVFLDFVVQGSTARYRA